MSLRDGTKKMSKSEESDYSRINLKDTTDEISKKIKKAKSDSEPIPQSLKGLEKKPEALNLVNIYSELSKSSLDKVLNEMSGKEYSFLKTKLAELLINEITPVGKEIKKLLNDKPYLMQVLKILIFFLRMNILYLTFHLKLCLNYFLIIRNIY